MKQSDIRYSASKYDKQVGLAIMRQLEWLRSEEGKAAKPCRILAGQLPPPPPGFKFRIG